MVAGNVRVGTWQCFLDWRIHGKLVSSGSSGVVVLRGDWTTRGGFGVAERRLVLHSFRRKPPVYKQTLCQKEGKLSVPFRSHFLLLSHFGARRQSVRSVEFWSSASKFEGRLKRFERHVVVRSGYQALFSLVHPVELNLARTLPSPHRPPPPPPISSFSSAVPRCTGRPRPHSSALASRSFRGLGFPSRAVASPVQTPSQWHATAQSTQHSKECNHMVTLRYPTSHREDLGPLQPIHAQDCNLPTRPRLSR